MLGSESKQHLLRLARAAIALHCERNGTITPADLAVPDDAELRQEMGAFVTLKMAGHLRGCIGEIVARRAIVDAVVGRAQDSAFSDPRFPPLRPDELPRCHIEISALHPPQAVAGPEDIVIGRHGIVLDKGGRSAVYLPQVAPEQGWDLAQTLSHLSQKAGLAPDAWRADCSFEVFEAEVFGE